MSRYFDYVEPLSYFVGLDLGQAADPSALCVLEEPLWIPNRETVDTTALHPHDRAGWLSPAELLPNQVQHFRRLNWGEGRPADVPLTVRRLHRWPLRTTYPQIVGDVERLLALEPFATRQTVLVLDATGVGAGVLDMFRVRGANPLAVHITAGDSEPHYDELAAGFKVAKSRLVMAARLALEQRLLTLPEQDPLAAVLVKELQDFRYKITQAANVTYSAREGVHDDILLALSLAVWCRAHLLRYVDAAMFTAQR